MFAEADLDIKKIAKTDETTSCLLTLAEQGILRDNFPLLGAIFQEKALPFRAD